jgi:hypothetical protein
MKIAALIIAGVVGCGASEAWAEASPAVPAAARPPPAQVDPQAVAALARMSAYLRSIPAFQIDLRTQRDDVDVYGQLITLSGEATYKIRQPDAFFIDLRLPTLTRQYVNDGKTVTIFDPTAGYYGKFGALPSIRSSLQLAEQRYGATVPLQDLFTWTEGDAKAKALTSAHVVGRDQIAGQAASHYAFRQPGTDWQIWIADGAKPVPLRIIIVDSDDPARPQFQADLAWDTAPTFAADTFAFKPPPNARATELRPLN